MSKRSYTPGPWKISSWTGNITTYDGVHVAGLDINSTRFPDAKLMAAAPEMFEALEKISRLDYSNAATNFAAYDAVQIAIRAIEKTKAKGDQ